MPPMTKNLMTRAQFAAHCGCSGAAVTKACAAALAPAVDGKYVDAAHPAAVAYHAERTKPVPPPTAPGVDARYEEAVAYCTETGRWSTTNIQKGLRVGYNRAKRMYDLMLVSKVAPPQGETTTPKPAPKTKPKEPHVRGVAANKEREKAEAWAADEDPDEVYEMPEHLAKYADMTVREVIERFGTDKRFVDWLSALQKIETINEKRLKNAQTEGTLIARELVRVAIMDNIDGVFTQLLSDGVKSMAAATHATALAGGTVQEIGAMMEDRMASYIRPAKVKMAKALQDGKN